MSGLKTHRFHIGLALQPTSSRDGVEAFVIASVYQLSHGKATNCQACESHTSDNRTRVAVSELRCLNGVKQGAQPVGE